MPEDIELEKKEKVDRIISFLQKGGTAQELYGIEDDDLEVMFVAASRYLQRQSHEEAADAFLFLTFLNPYHLRFWMGLGEAHRMGQRYDKAIEAYNMGSVYDYEDPRPYFHVAACHLSMTQPEEALEQLQVALEFCEGKNEFASMREVCYELIDDIAARLKEEQNV